MDTIIINSIAQTEIISYDFSFDCALQCSKLLTGSDEDHALVRRIAIRILDKWNRVPESTRSIWADIIEAVGFYPYITKIHDTARPDALADEIRQQSYLSEYLPDTYMHSEQKKLLNWLCSEQNVVASAPTSFGKSLLIEEMVASRKYENIVIIQPTLALLDETRIKLKKYNDVYKIIVRTSQEPAINKGNLFLLTAERVMEYAKLPHIDLLIIDEFYKMSLKRVDERADTLNNAFLKIYNTYKPKFYLLGPNIDRITDGFAEKYNAIFYKTDYSLVDCAVNLFAGINSEAEKKQKLFELLDNQASQQTLVYCSSPTRARGLARDYLKHLKESKVSSNVILPIIEWLNSAIPQWSLTEELKYGIAIHDGSLPKHIGASIIHYFNKGSLRCIFCTSTIIEGVNTSAKNVVIFDGKKGTKDIDFFDYSNIKGRSGRLMEHFLGNVYCFVPIPCETSVVIDIPFYEQDKSVLTSEILVNIRDSDVRPQVRQKYDELNNIEPGLLNIFKLNGTKIDGQKRIFEALERDLSICQDNIIWSQMPTYEQTVYILDLCEGNYFLLDESRAIRSVKQLAVYLNQYRTQGNIAIIIKGIYDYSIRKLKDPTVQRQTDHYDKAIETAFHIYRHWFQFKVPKAFRIVDSLQRYVCEKRGIKAGSYSYFVQQLENDFTQRNLSILVEYGIPSETVRKIERIVPADLSEDAVIQFIHDNRDSLFSQLMQYERDRLEQCL